MTTKQYLIHGVTIHGKTFRPSDWAARLCGVMSRFRPSDDYGDPKYTYSPYVCLEMTENIICVVVDERLRDIDPRALDFVLNFAKDNELVLTEICEIPAKK
jgi:hypothetical protein